MSRLFLILSASIFLVISHSSGQVQLSGQAGFDWLEKTFSLSRATPAVRWDFSKQEDRAAWNAIKHLTATATAGGVLLQTKGADPSFVATLPSSVPGPSAIKVVCRQTEEMSYLELFPAGADGNFGSRGMLRRMVLGRPDWQTIWFTVEPGELKTLRSKPESGKHNVELKEIAIYPLNVARAKEHPVLPKPGWKNTFYLVPIHETYDDARYNDTARRRDIEKLKSEFGRAGFTCAQAFPHPVR